MFGSKEWLQLHKRTIFVFKNSVNRAWLAHEKKKETEDNGLFVWLVGQPNLVRSAMAVNRLTNSPVSQSIG